MQSIARFWTELAVLISINQLPVRISRQVKTEVDRRSCLMKMNSCEMPDRESIECLAAFIAKLTVQREQTVAPHLGVTEEEIAAQLRAFSDIPVEKGFFVTKQGGRLTGLLGLEAELNKSQIHLIGPFVEETDWHGAADCLWNNLLTVVPPTINTCKVACDERNQRCIQFLKENGFAKYNAEATLRLNRKNWPAIPGRQSSVVIQEYSPDCEQQFRSLHSKGVYYTATEILQFLNDHKKLFVARENHLLKGYVYVEAKPEFGDADICFVAVEEKHRRNGIATLLLSRALDWSFSFQTIINAYVSVRVTNNPSMKLMEKLGFEEVKVIEAYSRKINSSGNIVNSEG